MKDWIENEDGSLSGLHPGQFQFGERYVSCCQCGTLRPASELFLEKDDEGNKFPACKDLRLCVTLENERIERIHSNTSGSSIS